MITEDDVFRTMRGLVNRGYYTAQQISDRTGLSTATITEVLELAYTQHLVYKALAQYSDTDAYMLTPTGQVTADNEALKRLAEMSRGLEYAPMWDADTAGSIPQRGPMWDGDIIGGGV